MPAAEANEVVETNSYELAFHVLPTVAEGEVARVVDDIKTYITNSGGTIGIEETPARIELAYNIEKYLEGKYRKFSSAYFGWVRFTTDPSTIAAITEELEGDMNVLRHLLLKLTKVEEEHPFYYHEALEEEQVANVDVEAALGSADEVTEKKEPEAAVETTETEATTASTETKEAVDESAEEEPKA